MRCLCNIIIKRDTLFGYLDPGKSVYYLKLDEGAHVVGWSDVGNE